MYMKERYTKRKTTNIDGVNDLLDMGLPQNLAEVMATRGVTAENYSYYFSDNYFHSPFDMKNMQEAVEVVSYILQDGGSILIYGDYDVDGLTASSMLSLFFADNGVDNDVIIPTREDGYGLHADLVIKAFKQKYYDLVLTVDCGISNRDDVEKIIEELDAEIIVTDHHELPETLPNCLCVNPKMGGYPFKNLAGAGVAWKLIEALAGREVAAKYSAFAMLGTIGDSMDMLDENRSIVKTGLSHLPQHKSVQKLVELSKCAKNLTAAELAMKVTPKINAPGRMGQPYVALQTLLARDRVNTPVIEQLLELNTQRIAASKQLDTDAFAACDWPTISKERVAFVYGDNFNHGMLGPLASHLLEKYGYPAIVMAKKQDGNYAGSSRANDGVDLFGAFCQCQDLLVKYGGHKAAVGFTVAAENLDKLRQRFSQLMQPLDQSVFAKELYYDVDLTDNARIEEMYDFVEKMQPFLPEGNIVFRVRDFVASSKCFGKDNDHFSATLNSGLEIKGFYKGQYKPFLKSGADVEALITLEMDEYSHRVCGIVKDAHLCNSVCFDELYKLNFLQNFTVGDVDYVSMQQAAKLLKEKSVLAIFDDAETYIETSGKLPLDDFEVDFFLDDGIAQKTVVISPLNTFQFDKYSNVVCFCKRGMRRILPQNAVYAQVAPANDQLYEVELDRNVCALTFAALKKKSQYDSVKGVFDKYLMGKMQYEQYVVALRVLQELNFLKIEDKYTVTFLPAEKSDLANSALFRCFQKN